MPELFFEDLCLVVIMIATKSKIPDSAFDVIIIGAGLSGINSANRLQTAFPNLEYAILESRKNMGGTWSLFKYPGIRSDSDLYTFGFQWRPWDKPNGIAEGHLIREYIEESAAAFGIEKRILYNHKVVSLDWSDNARQWSVGVETLDGMQSKTARFLITATGYYDYKHSLPIRIPEIEKFKGEVIHPQFWPSNLDYEGKKIAIIGSGATAITLLPALAKTASRVTMIQRSPSFVLCIDMDNSFHVFCLKVLPEWMAYNLMRWKHILTHSCAYMVSRRWPRLARKYVRMEATKRLPSIIPHDPHFDPSYNVWDQRLCISPDGDFFKALRGGNADIVTDSIKTVNEDGIVTESGKFIDADIIITATGLKVLMLGGSRLSVNGTEVRIGEKYFWKGMMVQDLPNAAVVLGYTNTSFTLGADMTVDNFVRLMEYMDKHGYEVMRPQVPEGVSMETKLWTRFTSTYLKEAEGLIPDCGDRGNWLPRRNYLIDYWKYKLGSLTDGLVFEKAYGRKPTAFLKATPKFPVAINLLRLSLFLLPICLAYCRY